MTNNPIPFPRPPTIYEENALMTTDQIAEHFNLPRDVARQIGREYSPFRKHFRTQWKHVVKWLDEHSGKEDNRK